MRITGGALKGRIITCPPGIIRPAMDRMRESIFNILGNLDGYSFLDLFTGSGIIALEAASRGAYPVRAIEKDRGKKEVILQNLELANGAVELSLMPAERFVMGWKESFDFIFLDPPFPYPHKADLLLRVAKSRLVNTGTTILIHYPQGDKIPDILPAPSVNSPGPRPGFLQDAQDVSNSQNDVTQENKINITTNREFILSDHRQFGRSQLRIYRYQG